MMIIEKINRILYLPKNTFNGGWEIQLKEAIICVCGWCSDFLGINIFKKIEIVGIN